MVSRKNAKQKNVAEPSFGSSALLHGLALAMHRVLFVGRSSTWWSTRDPCRILSFKTCDSDEIGSGWGLGATFLVRSQAVPFSSVDDNVSSDSYQPKQQQHVARLSQHIWALLAKFFRNGTVTLSLLFSN